MLGVQNFYAARKPAFKVKNTDFKRQVFENCYYLCKRLINNKLLSVYTVYALIRKYFTFMANYNICEYYNTYQICVNTFHRNIYPKTTLI